jgi:DNA-binding beta-propeller fold protein YncE
VAVCASPSGRCFNADGSRAFVSCTGEESVTVLDSASGEVLSRVPAGSAMVNKPYALSPTAPVIVCWSPTNFRLQCPCSI